MDDVEFENEDTSESSAHEKFLEKNKKLKEELKQCKAERQEYLDGWQRLRADVANTKRDESASRARLESAVREEVITDIIPILDSFDMAMQGKGWEAVDEAWRTGIEHIRTQCMNILEKHGISSFGTVGEHFNPEIHEAVKEVVDSKKNQNTIARVVRSGYKTDEKILRPAQVEVTK